MVPEYSLVLDSSRCNIGAFTVSFPMKNEVYECLRAFPPAPDLVEVSIPRDETSELKKKKSGDKVAY